jgi:hypothetical protein
MTLNRAYPILILVVMVYGWDYEGHVLVAQLADRMLSSTATNFVNYHLNGDSMASVSSWADSMTWSADLHFSHTPHGDCAAFDPARDCGFNGSGRCIVSGIANYTLRASDASLSPDERTEALKFLIHMYADIHQPLHTGFKEDHGGVDIMLGSPVGNTLHQLWDGFLVEYAMKTLIQRGDRSISRVSLLLDKLKEDWSESTREEVSSIVPKQEHIDSRDMNQMIHQIGKMASETSTTLTCKSAYFDDILIQSSHVISKLYKNSRSRVVVSQLTKSAIRLSVALREIAVVYYRDTRLMKEASVRTIVPTEGGFLRPIIPDSLVLSNRYAELSENEFDFGPEEVVEDYPSMGDPTGVISPETVIEVPGSPRRSSRRFSEADVISASDVALITHEKAYMLTSRQLARNQKYIPTSLFSYWVRFMGNRHVLINFDAAVFPHSTRIMARAMFALRRKVIRGGQSLAPVDAADDIVLEAGLRAPNETDDGAPDIVQVMDDLSEESLIRFRALHGISESEWRNTLTPSEMKDRFRRMVPAAFGKYENGIFFVSLVTVLRSAPHPVMRYNKHKLLDSRSGGLSLVIIDKNLYDGDMDDEIGGIIADIVRKSRKIMIPRWIVRDLDAIRAQLFGGSSAHIIDKFDTFVSWPDCAEENFYHLEWQLKHPETSPP